MKVSAQLQASVALPPPEIAPGTNWIGGWVGLSVGLDVVDKIKSCIARNRTQAVQPTDRLYIDWGIPCVCVCVCVCVVQGAAYYQERKAHSLQNWNIPCLRVSGSLVPDKQFCNLHIKLSATTKLLPELSPKEQYALYSSATGNWLRMSLDRLPKNG
jgi:hypothetical protein